MEEATLQKFVAQIYFSESLGHWSGYMDMIREMWEDAALRAGATYLPPDQKLDVTVENRWLEDGTPVPSLRVEGRAGRPHDAEDA
jgi:hypothetical protein